MAAEVVAEAASTAADVVAEGVTEAAPASAADEVVAEALRPRQTRSCLLSPAVHCRPTGRRVCHDDGPIFLPVPAGLPLSHGQTLHATDARVVVVAELLPRGRPILPLQIVVAIVDIRGGFRHRRPVRDAFPTVVRRRQRWQAAGAAGIVAPAAFPF